VANAIGRDSRIGPKFLKASVGFGGSCFQKDILNLVYLCEHFGLPEVAGFWEGVVKMKRMAEAPVHGQDREGALQLGRRQEDSCARLRLQEGHERHAESAAIAVCRDLIAEQARVTVYDPKVPEDEIRRDVLGKDGANPLLSVASSGYDAASAPTPW